MNLIAFHDGSRGDILRYAGTSRGFCEEYGEFMLGAFSGGWSN